MRSKNYHGCSHKIPKTDKRQASWTKQRKERGFDDTETWNLDYVAAAFILPRLKRFREVNIGFPGELTFKEFCAIIDEMIAAFEIIVRADEITWTKKTSQQVNRGLKHFAKYFRDLWW